MSNIYQPLAPEALQSPLAMYDVLRQTGSVLWHEQLSSWICTTYAECRTALANPQVFTTDPTKIGIEIPPERRNIQTLDPPEYLAPRRALAQEFQRVEFSTFGEVAAKEAATQVRAYLQGDIALVRAIGLFTLRTVSQVLGIPGLDEDAFLSLSELLVRGMDFGFRPESAQPSDDARAAISHMIDGIARENRLTGLAESIFDNFAQTNREFALNSLRVLLHAGYSSSCRLIENSIAVLAADLEIQHQLQGSDDGRWRLAVNEFARFDGPVQAEARIVASDIELGGQELLRGDLFVLVLGSANTDPEQFSDPRRVDIDRQPNPHLGFGRGLHSCLGARIATVQVQSFLQELLFWGTLSFDGQPVRRDNATLRGFAELPLKIDEHRLGPDREKA